MSRTFSYVLILELCVCTNKKGFLYPLPLGHQGLLHITHWLHDLGVYRYLSLEKMGIFSEGKFLCSW